MDANVTTPGGDALPLQVSHHNDKPFRPENRDQTMAAVALLEKRVIGFWIVKTNRPAASPAHRLSRQRFSRRRVRVWVTA